MDLSQGGIGDHHLAGGCDLLRLGHTVNVVARDHQFNMLTVAHVRGEDRAAVDADPQAQRERAHRR